MHRNIYKSVSQEFRLASDFDFPLNFMAGFVYQDVQQEFHAFQYAVNTALNPGIGPDPVTGNGYDYNKNHFLDTSVYSFFIAGYWDITDEIEATAGVRYTNESKDGHITIPYMHAFLASIGFLPSGSRVGGLEFDDDDLSPEFALNWSITDEISVYGAYKQAFKSGGIDNSALPNNSLNTSNPNFPGLLIYDSEKAKGGEIGIKTQLLDSTLRLSATGFRYRYEDLQVQQFDSVAIQFATYNASELTTQGFEADFLWQTPLDGLTFRGALAYTNAEYSKFFDVNPSVVIVADLDGRDRERNADFAMYAGGSYEIPVFAGWMLGFATDARYNSGYGLEGRVTPWEQDSFTLVDASVRLYSEDNRWEVSLIAKNLSDKTYAFSEGTRPGAVIGASGFQDRVTTTSIGREITLQLRARF